MIPFFQANIIIAGPLTIQVWGLFVSLGIIAAVILARHWARKVFLSVDAVTDLAIWALVGGLIGARLAHIFLYDFSYYCQHWVEVFYVWQGGASSLGGFIGALVGVVLFAKKRGFTLKELLPYFDVMSLALWLGWGIGRLGCFMIHDHIGRLSNFFLAVNFPDGARFDLGLLESILAFVIFAVFSWQFLKIIKKKWGLVFGLSFAAYGVVRFGLDFLRASDLPSSDVRYGCFTPMQWGILLVFVGLTIYFICSKILKRK